DGFNLPEGRNSAVWLDRDTLLISSSLGAGMSTRTGDPRTVRLWRRGTDPLAAPVIFETKDGIGVWASVDRTVAHERVLFIEKSSFLDSNFWIGDPAGPKTHLDVPTDAWVQVDRDFIVVKPRTHDRRGDLRAGHRSRHVVYGVPRRRPSFHAPVRAGRAARASGLLLVRRPARAVDPRRSQAGLRGAHADRRRLVAGAHHRPARSRHRSCVVARSLSGGIERRSPGPGARSAHPTLAVPDRAGSGAAGAQTRPAGFRPEGARHQPARSDLERRRAHPL